MAIPLCVVKDDKQESVRNR